MRLEPALSKFPVAFFVGKTTSVLDDEAIGEAKAPAGGEVSRFLLVVGLDLPFLKNGTLMDSAEAMVVCKQCLWVTVSFDQRMTEAGSPMDATVYSHG